MENQVRTSTLKVVEKARDAKINRERVKELAQKWVKEKIVVPPWPKEFHLQTKSRQAMLDYLIILDAINFCFWNKNKIWTFNYNGKKYYGYFGLSLALKKFFEENPEKGSLNYFADIPFGDFLKILNGGKNLQFLRKRWQIARQVSKKIIKKYGESEKFILSVHHKLSELVLKISKELFSFDDIAHYKGRKVYILKRAQILPADIWGAFGGKGIGYFEDLDYLTAFADYKLPQILQFWGILEYSPRLLKKIKDRIIIAKGSKEEIEIRSSTIWAVEYLKEELGELGRNIFPFQVDWILWNRSQEQKILTPYHLTKTFYY